VPIFIIDANLPYYFSLWKNADFIHLRDLNDEWTDEELWIYAKENKLTIITKDSDFSNKIIFSKPPPKVIHIRFGNLKMNPFFELMTKLWNDAAEMNKSHKLVNVFNDRIEGIE
jgi:predicted nuclease of predicted toxin-antitoxin system